MKQKPVWDDTLPEKGRVAWMKANTPEKEAALIHATEFLDTLPFKGRRLSDEQALSWPRSGIIRDDGSPVLGVPPEVKEAASMVAGFILAEIPFGPQAVAHVFSLLGHLLEDEVDLSDEHVSWH